MEPGPAKLCCYCSRLIPPRKESSSERAHQPNVALFLQSGDGCVMCKMIRDHWSLGEARRRFPDVDEATYESIPITVKFGDVQSLASGVSWAILQVELHLLSHAFVYTNTFSITTCKFESSAAHRPIWKASTTSIQDKISTLKSWVHDCDSQHENCKPIAGCTPKRLIDVNAQPPRLVIGQHLQSRDIRYATLSHCWGDSLPLRTTKETEHLYSQEIPYGLIPPTFHDALTIARALDIPYLWIDALCIVQDDYIEWQSEASKMQDIYSGSSLTIAATDAFDSLEGCFFNDNRSSDSGLDKLGNNKDHQECVFFTTYDLGGNSATIVRMQPRNIRVATENTVLDTRGWVLQEWVLSHRTVHCMRSELHWQCRSSYQTETGIIFDPVTMQHKAIPILDPQKPTALDKTWWRWMENYSGRRFSIPKDKLPAIAGIVQYYQTLTGDTPILGLWGRSFHKDLLWMRLTEREDITTRLPNIPSWSWLSCPEKISFDFWSTWGDEDDPDVDIQDHAVLVEWDVTWSYLPLTSDIKSTRLVIDGPIREISLSVAPEAEDFNPPYFDVENEKPDFDEHPIPWRSAGQFDAESRRPPSRYLCLLLRSRIHEKSKRVHETFLILEPSGHPTATAYRRVGIGFFSGRSRTFDSTVRRNLSLV